MIGRPFLLASETIMASEEFFQFFMEEKLKFRRLMVDEGGGSGWSSAL